MWAALISWLPALVAKVMASLGIGFLAFQGADLAIAAVVGYVQTQIGGIPGEYIGLLGLFGLDTALSLMLSGWVAAAGLSVARAGIRMVSAT